MGLLTFTDRGIYCEQADVYLDPWRRVDRAIISHAHADHARSGMGSYCAQHDSAPILKLRLGAHINLETKSYGEAFCLNGVTFSFHPAGHIIGSAQIRVEYNGEIWVFSGDYKTQSDNLAVPFEPVACHTFISESTFGLPVYRWADDQSTFDAINGWWRKNQDEGFTSVLCGYSLGKSQRLLCGLDLSIGRVYTHGAVAQINNAFLAHGIKLPAHLHANKGIPKNDYTGQLVITPSSALGTPWMNKFKPYRTAIASGWMSLRGTKRRQNVDRGFVLSDHADWKGLNEAVAATGAERVYVTHGYQEVFASWLSEKGYDAHVASTDYNEEASDDQALSEDEPNNSSK